MPLQHPLLNVRPRGNDLMQQEMSSLSLLRQKLTKALEMDKGGIPTWLITELNTIAQNAQSINQEIDIQHI